MGIGQDFYGGWALVLFCSNYFVPVSTVCVCPDDNSTTTATPHVAPKVLQMTFSGILYVTTTTSTSTSTSTTYNSTSAYNSTSLTSTSECVCVGTTTTTSTLVIRLAAIVTFDHDELTGMKESTSSTKLRHGYQLAVNWINARRGGIFVNGHWHPVQMTFFDNAANATATRLLAEYLINTAHYNFIFGPAGAHANEQLSEVVASSGSKALAILPACGNVSVFGHRPMVYGILPDAKRRTESVFTLLNTPPYNTNGGQPWTFAFVEEVNNLESMQECQNLVYYANTTNPRMVNKNSISLQREVFWKPASNDGAAHWDRQELHAVTAWLQQTDADLVFMCVEDTFCVALLNSFREKNYNPRGLIVSDNCIALMGSRGDFLLGISAWVPQLNHVSSHYFTPGVSWTSLLFTAEYLETFAPSGDASTSTSWQPNHLSASAFSSLEVLVSAIEIANSLAPQDVDYVMQTTNFATIFGSVRFNTTGENNAIYKLVQKQTEGVYTIVSPQEDKTAEVIFPRPTWYESYCYLVAPDPTGTLQDAHYSILGFDTGRVKYGTPATTTMLTYSALMNAAAYAATTLGANTITAVASANTSWYLWMAAVGLAPTDGLSDFVSQTEVSCSHTDQGLHCLFDDAMDNFTQTIFRGYTVTSQMIARESMLAYLYTLENQQVCGPCRSNMVATYNWATYRRECHVCSDNKVPTMRNGNYLLRECSALCPPGYGKNDSFFSVCSPCTPGKSSIVSECQDCEQGRYTSESNMTQCSRCSVGTYADKVGMSACKQCAKGYEAQTTGAAQCSNCTLGTIAPSVGTSACMLCPSGSIASQASMTQCETCFPGSFSAWGAKTCLDCEMGKYQNRANTSVCNDGVTGATFNAMGLVKGNNSFQYWTHQEGTLLKWEFCGHVPDACLEGETCAFGSTGIQCSACLPDYFVPSFTKDESCIECPSLIWNLVVSFFGVTGVVFFALCLSRLSIASVKRPNDLHVPLIKILIHWGFMCGIFAMLLRNLVFVHRETLNKSIAAFTLWGCWLFMEAFMGKPYLETSSWSINCIFQRSEEGLADVLKPLKHSDWYKSEYQADIRKLKTAHEATESDMVVFWILAPLIIMSLAYLFSVLYMSFYFLRYSGTLAEANQFYNDLLNEQQGPAYVRENYNDQSLQPYFNLYKSRVLGIWWPFNYLSAAHKRQGCCYRRRTFGSETQPVCQSVLLLLYGMSVVSIMRPRDCTKFGDSEMRMIAASTIVCDQEESEDLFWWSTFGCLCWGVIFPIIVFAQVQLRKSKLMHEDWWKEEHSVYILGYNAKCYWWESVVFLDKFCLAIVAHSGMEDDHQILFQFMLVILYGVFTTAFKPFDRRCHSILWRVQVFFIIIRVLLCIALEFVLLTDNDFGWLFAITVVVCANLGFLAYVGYLLWYYGSTSFIQCHNGGSDSLSWLKIKGVEEVRRSGPIARFVQKFEEWVNDQHVRAQQKQPYACFDHLLGWITVVGSRADLAYPTHIHRGNRCQNPHGVTLLSKAPDLPAKEPHIVPERPIVKASPQHKRYLQEAISEVMSHIATGMGKTFSVSLLEFIVRAGILFAVKFSDDRKLKLEDEEKELDEVIVKLTMEESFEHAATAHTSNNFLHDMSDAMTHKMTSMSQAGRLKKGSHAHKLHQKNSSAGFEEEDDIDTTMLTLELFTDEIKHRPKRNPKERHDHTHNTSLEISSGAGNTLAGGVIRKMSKTSRALRRSVQNTISNSGQPISEEKLSSEHVSMRRSEIPGDGRIRPPKDNTESVTKSQRRQLALWVEEMMDAKLYSLGVRLETLQQGMLRLQMMKRNELKYMINKFEEEWVKQSYVKAIILKRYGNMVQDTAVQCDFDNQKEEIRPDNVEEIICEELKFGDFAEKRVTAEALEKERTVGMKWARFVIMFGHTLSLFKTNEMVSLVKRKRDAVVNPLRDAVSREQAKLDMMKKYLDAKRGITSSDKVLDAPSDQDPAKPPNSQTPTNTLVAPSSNSTTSENILRAPPPMPPPAEAPPGHDEARDRIASGSRTTSYLS